MNVGIAGIGFMGWIHWLAYQKNRDLNVKAVCARSEKKRQGDWTDIKGNFGPPGDKVDLTGTSAYAQLDELLNDPDLDIIDICLPPNLHAEAAIKAFEAGKHVFCEKPLALNIDDCRQMVEAAQKHDRLLLVGHVLPYVPEYAYAIKAAQEEKFGKLLGGWFKRVISDPQWLPDFWDAGRVGGPLIDLHVHDAHLIRLLFGMPHAVTSAGRMRGDVVEYCNSVFHFDEPRYTVGAASGVIRQQARGFTHGYEIHFEEATLQYELAVVEDEPVVMMPLTVYDRNGKATQPKLDEGDMVAAFETEVGELARSVNSGEASPILAGELARDAIKLCQKQTESVEHGKTFEI